MTPLSIAFLPLTDSAALVAARALGLAAGEGLDLNLVRDTSWATVRGGRVTGFRTYMTGEVYGLFGRHSILARTLDADAPLDAAAFRRGAAQAGNGEGLLHNAFGVRALGLFDRLSPPESASYLSGLLIGEEIGGQTLPESGEVIVIGAWALVERYALALGESKANVRTFGAEATWAGLRALQP